MTAWISSSVAVDFITIIFWLLLATVRTGYGRCGFGARPEGQLGGGAALAGRPAERLAKSPDAIGEGVAATVRRGRGGGETGGVVVPAGHGSRSPVVPASPGRVHAGGPIV